MRQLVGGMGVCVCRGGGEELVLKLKIDGLIRGIGGWDTYTNDSAALS